ncbi:glycosyltransferase family 2 protein [Leucobacter sp. wl10]|uniref:glycosyltransferase n=1 Tax=Leucobacter sp. wl10 TaxID=2304677 RepID=UPI000E5AB717|nr:glycosyltransferase family 2 protein [Leucobacter sp. wl10]RGE19577.1 glycosyltransferase family 2 protein [Leucobacter sp. wl10]
MENEIPLGRRSTLYRAFEVFPALISFAMLALLVILPLISPGLAAWYVLAVVGVMFLRALRSAVDIARGYRRLRSAEAVDWSMRLAELADPRAVLARGEVTASGFFDCDEHLRALRRIAADPEAYPDPRGIRNAVIIAAYNEPYEVIAPTVRSLVASRFERSRMAVFFAYEERGGIEIERTALRLKREFGDAFAAFVPVKHPSDAPGEIAGKGSNITFAGRALARWAAERGIDPSDVLVTTLDCDNRPHPDYFACTTYRYVLNRDRKRTAFQPVSLFLGNIWDAPAPTRVVASGNTFWNIIASVRPLTLRNFASHTQPLDALIEMGFWSTRTIVEDGHQYWRSYFHFRGRYAIDPIPLPVYQDAVLADTYARTLVAQFRQLSRWSYGASDVPYVAVRVFGRRRPAPFWPSLWRLLTLLDSQVTLASVPIIIAIGGWIPIALAGRLVRGEEFVSSLPILVGGVQQIATLGLLLSIVLGWRLLPPRPDRYGPVRNLGMVLQWVLFPVTVIVFNSFTALHSQGRLAVGSYRERFDVTVKAAVRPGVRTAVPARTGPIDALS